MTHQEWQLLIPFYIADTLPTQQKQQFEHHLRDCDSCQHEIAEWRSIASAVWANAEDAAQHLPPLSPEVYNRLQYRDKPPVSKHAANPPRPSYAPPSRQKQRVQLQPRRRKQPSRAKQIALPVTVAAGFIVAVLFGGLIVMLTIGNLPQDDVSPNEVALGITQEIVVTPETNPVDNVEAASIDRGDSSNTVQENPSPMPTQTATLDVRIGLSSQEMTAVAPPTIDARIAVSPQPNIAQQNTLNPLPTHTPFVSQAASNNQTNQTGMRDNSTSLTNPNPQSGGGNNNLPNNPPIEMGGGSEDVAAMAAPMIEGDGPYITTTPNLQQDGYHLCFIFNPTDAPLSLYQHANDMAEVIAFLASGEEYRTLVRSENGWYQVLIPRRDNSSVTITWMPPETAYLRGNCDDDLFWVPTPTQAPRVNLTPSPTTIVVRDNLWLIAEYGEVNAFANPDTSGVLATLPQGFTAQIVASTGVGANQWVRIQLDTGQSAWVQASSVRVVVR